MHSHNMTPVTSLQDCNIAAKLNRTFHISSLELLLQAMPKEMVVSKI